MMTNVSYEGIKPTEIDYMMNYFHARHHCNSKCASINIALVKLKNEGVKVA